MNLMGGGSVTKRRHAKHRLSSGACGLHAGILCDGRPKGNIVAGSTNAPGVTTDVRVLHPPHTCARHSIFFERVIFSFRLSTRADHSSGARGVLVS